MKRFLLNVFVFGAILTSATVAAVLITAHIGYSVFEFELPKEKNVLVLGNSHPECAIDDRAIPNLVNLAKSGSGYFYDYLKLREITKHNSHIDTLILGYGYQDLHKDMDSWFSGEEKFKIRTHFILFTFQDYTSLFKANPIKVLAHTPQTIYSNLIGAYSGYENLGGYIHSKRDKLIEGKERLRLRKQIKASDGYSQYQSKYLLKIYEHCVKNNIELLLLNVPIHPLELEYLKDLIPNYHKFAKKNLPKARIIDHADFKIPESHYGDLEHLNYRGAERYTTFLKFNDFDD